MAAIVAVLAAAALLLAPTVLDGAHASFSATTANSGDAWAADQLQPPSNLTVSSSCTLTPTIARRASSTATGAGSVTLPMPANTTAGDYLLAHVGYHDDTQTLIAPSGWQLVGRTDNTTIASNVYWKEAGANEPSATFRHPTSGSTLYFAGGVTAFRNARLVAPLFAGVPGSSDTATTPSVTTQDKNVQVVHLFTKTQGPLDPASGGADFYGTSTGTGDGVHVGIRGAGETFGGPGSTTPRSATALESSRWVAQVVVLQRVADTATANLSWTPTPSTWADGYRLERAGGGATTSSTLAAGTSSVSQGPLADGTAYTFTLTAARNAWRSSPVTRTLTPDC
ncbi:hypothetical protein O2W14_06940 [Modestobacter sp. VKM Ac-2986]|uniref:hypothetical protein n=1 Tax=Modestobacter sp. VKM Ac-2986 TaxID=3004140 RepID=UPI0022AA3AFE|nr:hypothetical protein [Modestobacter sp. VKM Ac-2986]MCZ2828565.1 hypothetical protein [Modestobacter sp. VKM Ac-2986]